MSKNERMKNFERKIKKIMTNRDYDSQRELENWNVHFECCDVKRYITKNQ